MKYFLVKAMYSILSASKYLVRNFIIWFQNGDAEKLTVACKALQCCFISTLNLWWIFYLLKRPTRDSEMISINFTHFQLKRVLNVRSFVRLFIWVRIYRYRKQLRSLHVLFIVAYKAISGRCYEAFNRHAAPKISFLSPPSSFQIHEQPLENQSKANNYVWAFVYTYLCPYNNKEH